MEHTIKGLGAKLNHVQRKRKSLVEEVQKFEEALKEAFGDTEIFGISSDVTLEQIGFDEYLYGRLSYGRDTGLTVAYRTTSDDIYDGAHGTPVEERTYTVKELSICPAVWLEKLFDKSLSSLLENLNAKIDEMDGRADQSLVALEKILAAESAEIDAEMVETLKQYGSDSLGKSWSTVLTAVNLDTTDSLTRSSSFLESVCKKILNDRGVEFPQKKTMAVLIDECLKCLEWHSTMEAEDVKKITGGLKSIALGISSLRTHFGTAHGASSDQDQLEVSYARLSKNTCASVAIFLLSRHMKNAH